MSDYPPRPPSEPPDPSVIPPGSYLASDGNACSEQKGYRPQVGFPIPPQKSGSKKVLFIVLGVVGGLCVLGIIGAALGANKTADKPEAFGTTSSSSAAGTDTTLALVAPASKAAPTPEPTTPPASAVPANYVGVASMAGSGTKHQRSQVFTLSGKARMHYNYAGDFQGRFVAILVKEGEAPFSDHDTCKSGCEATIQLPQKGNYYLDIWAYTGDWAVTIEDLP